MSADTLTPAPSHAGPAASAPPPTGRYKLGAEIARGGMGEVYAAWDHVLDRQVAVKVLQPRLAGTAAERRFFTEARITGQLQHPGIPPVYDLGTLSAGRPFLAMKLVEGSTLEVLLRRDGPGGQWLAVFEAVAQAVAYAHAHGVIHRDLKPTNIMVGEFGEVQVMDWGLAKALAGGWAGAAGLPADLDGLLSAADTPDPGPNPTPDGTPAGDVIGTPAYMSPEQAVGAVDRQNLRTDVFGLGALLYTLLTGHPPYPAGSVESKHRQAARGQLADAFGRLDACGADPDVAALCRRCLAPDPKGRPADAGEVAAAVADLRRAADDRARAAERDRHAAEVRAGEQAGRRRLAQRLCGAAAGVLLLGLTGTTAGLVRADAARRRAEAAERATADQLRQTEAARAAADEQTRLAVATKTFLRRDLLRLADPAALVADGRLKPAADVTLRDVLLRASAAIDGRFAAQPAVEAELRDTLGSALLGVGRADPALRHLERAWELYARLLGPDHPDALTSLAGVGMSLSALGRHADALRVDEECLAARRRVLGPDHPGTLWALNNVAVQHAYLGRHADALRLHEECLAARRRVLGPDHPDALSSLGNAALALSDVGRHAEAVPKHEECLAAVRRVLGPDHPSTLTNLNSLANSYAAVGRDADALRVRQECLAARRRVLGPDHPNALKSAHNLANSYTAAGRHDDALKLREECLAAQRRVLGPDHPDALTCLFDLGTSYARLGRTADALRVREESLAGRRRVLGPDHPDTLRSLAVVAVSYRGVGRHAEALPMLQEAFDKLVETLPAGHETLHFAAANLAGCYTFLGRGADATATADRYLKRAAGQPGVGLGRVSVLLQARNRHLQQTGDAAGCRATAELAEGFRPAGPAELYDAACFRAVAAGVSARAGRPADAAADADRTMDWLRRAVAAGFQDRRHLQRDADFAPLRDRADFRALRDGLPEVAPPPRPAG